MKVNELRIGNYILFDNDVYDVRGFVNERVKIHKKEVYIGQLFKPIPLTEEWLLNFGFEKHHQSFYNKTLCVREVEYLWFYSIYPLKNSIIPLVNMSAQATGHYIKYVHQLQNLYFALTGEELKLLNNE